MKYQQLIIPGLEEYDIEFLAEQYDVGKPFKSFSECVNYMKKNTAIKGKPSEHGLRILNHLVQQGIADHDNYVYDFICDRTRRLFTQKYADEEIDKLGRLVTKIF